MAIPRFAELPIVADAPPQSSWGVFGRDDQRGTLNFLSDERRLAALRLIQHGRTFNLDLPLELPVQPIFASRTPHRHRVLHRPGTFGRDDVLDNFHPQGSTQWDALKHISHPDYGFYNWATDADITADVTRLGVQNYAAEGIVGRGVLLDAARYFEGIGQPLQPDAHHDITAADLDAIARAQEVEVLPGDIVLLRTGVAKLLHAEAEHPESVVRPLPGSPGLAANDASLAWLWDHQVAAIASDNVTVEAFPMTRDSLHRRGIALLGLVLGEMFDFESLAEACAADGRYACFFASKPLNLTGGVGSPGNALAIK
jgi:kynurenine formamidase